MDLERPGLTAEGLLFMRAYTPNAKCAPSRACILTGRNSWQLEEAANHWPHFPDKFVTYCETLGAAGYHVGFTAKGWAPGRVGKGRKLTGKAYNKHRRKPPARGINSTDYASNFKDFLADAGENPWTFWYGCTEPHRGYEFKSGVSKGGKKLSDIPKVPAFWPDNDTIRHDMLDYAYEIEHFDHHLVRMIKMIEDAKQLNNTIIVVTADNGMPFPRVKGQKFEWSNHLPLAIMWPKGIAKPGRKIDDYVSFIDLAPTFLEVAGIQRAPTKMQPITGRSLTDIFSSEKSGQVNPQRDHVLIGKERHDIGRPNDWGYPVRGIVKGGKLYLMNFKTDRWPAGNPETGYLNTDGSPTKSQVLQMRRDGTNKTFWAENFGKRPAEQLFDVVTDSECMKNLAGDAGYAELKAALKKQMTEELTAQKDPRILGTGDVFDAYPYAGGSGYYERYMKTKKHTAGWVNKSDYEKEPLD